MNYIRFTLDSKGCVLINMDNVTEIYQRGVGGSVLYFNTSTSEENISTEVSEDISEIESLINNM